MNANALAPLGNTMQPTKPLIRKAAQADSAHVLSDIYNENVNIVIWQRALAEKLAASVSSLIATNSIKDLELAVTPDDAFEKLTTALKINDTNRDSIHTLCTDIALLVDMFCCLFELKRAGLRLTLLTRPMCPRFHVDRIPCRLVTTYQGVATQWLEHNEVERSKLGAGNLGKPDESSGLFKSISNIKQLKQGDIALLKGEYWDDNEGAGLVHRSPPVESNEQRLLLTLDFI
ncbi:DUF1826 domain-containing protein [Pseudoalteromonas sp. MMG010]|uniref:DUF1826 domain-containing protein n=1 Tax=Pseudoalteromonas sp. MMG010 TaxID=2822685 RepID=UPI001B3A63DB|nr:DUF1826 domain-containing protein [Pseudoalteromonas sp. MMG010]MBQ4834506.1 DUF1826 domain-containing protein [Pseudoalteromonas sp. MMG010]